MSLDRQAECLRHGAARESKSMTMARVAFISSMDSASWGGSEELWWSGAMTLLERGHRVDVVRPVVVQSHPRIVALASRGGRTTALSTGGERPLLALSALTPRRWRINERRQAGLAAAFEIARRRPHLVVVSQGQNYDGLLFAQMAQRLRVPYVVISQKASERYWPPDTGRDRLHLVTIDVDADDLLARLSERDGERQPDVSQSDDSDCHGPRNIAAASAVRSRTDRARWGASGAL